jgi:putative multiple sugar transport system ATP-binding protein
MKNQLQKLIDVKSIITIALTILFIVLSIKGIIDGKEVVLKNVQSAIKHGLAYVTEDRKGNGLILSNPIKINTTLANLSDVSRRKIIDKDKEYQVAVEYKEKLNTKAPSVEQNVGNLSGGNQQKVLLAKWMFADPEILILDDSASALDFATDLALRKALAELPGEKTLFIVSQRTSSVRQADQIIVLDDGEMAGLGTHDELMEKCSVYQEIYYSQNGGRDNE